MVLDPVLHLVRHDHGEDVAARRLLKISVLSIDVTAQRTGRRIAFTLRRRMRRESGSRPPPTATRSERPLHIFDRATNASGTIMPGP